MRGALATGVMSFVVAPFVPLALGPDRRVVEGVVLVALRVVDESRMGDVELRGQNKTQMYHILVLHWLCYSRREGNMWYAPAGIGLWHADCRGSYRDVVGGRGACNSL